MKNRSILLEKIDKCITSGVQEGVFPGANYCLVIDDAEYYGSFGNKATHPVIEPNKLDTVYDIASLTKVVGTTTAILKLVEEGQLKLEDKVSQYLPFIDNDIVTIRHLMTHSSGYPALTPGTEEMTSVEPLLNDLRACTLEYEPDSKVVYSDVGFMYLGFIIEKITGSLPRYLKEHFFKPLNMQDTCFNHKDLVRIAPTEIFGFRGLIRGSVHDEKGFLLDGVAGHAGIYSTVKDLGIFAKMILNQGEFNGRRYLSEASIECIQKKMIPIDGDFRSIGWIVRNVSDHEVIYHTGYTGTSLLIDFEKKLAFILLSNRVHPTRTNIQIIGFRKRLEAILYENL
ncbi:serine hydrolase domain-containing protein [Fusibacter ferrireducens]|uniref:Beta-lactamase family protein n=1 Tax=Fusibacter ferrireducens TaxID=2785058 RepID=A0ABR9ZVC4_9FIRM|nr:serine hydrolase domain-containing protein [Fusibacter ferrireducens]MBF4694370.1 beta-lactamase family protein [Fusibacter ferrireducens]